MSQAAGIPAVSANGILPQRTSARWIRPFTRDALRELRVLQRVPQMALTHLNPSPPLIIMLQSILTTLFDILGTTIWVICAVIARIAQCLMK